VEPTIPNRATVNQALGEQQPITRGYRAARSSRHDALYASSSAIRRRSRRIAPRDRPSPRSRLLVDDDFYAATPHAVGPLASRNAHSVTGPQPGAQQACRRAARSKDPTTFCSGRGVLYNLLRDEPADVPGSLLTADPPLHTEYRRILQPAFSPARMRAIEARLRAWAQTLLDAVPTGEPFDFVRAVSVPYPLIVLAELMGISADDWPRYHQWVDAAVSGSSYRVRPAHLQAALDDMNAFPAMRRRARVTPDMVYAALAHHQRDGRRSVTPS
jgi:cytochrome P450